MKPIKQAIVLVDAHDKNKAKRFRVGAKSEREAEKFVRIHVKSGSVKFYYWNTDANPVANYKQIIREV